MKRFILQQTNELIIIQKQSWKSAQQLSSVLWWNGGSGDGAADLG